MRESAGMWGCQTFNTRVVFIDQNTLSFSYFFFHIQSYVNSNCRKQLTGQFFLNIDIFFKAFKGLKNFFY